MKQNSLVAITASDLSKAGIQTVITQNDVLDIIAEQCMEGIRAKIEEFNQALEKIKEDTWLTWIGPKRKKLAEFLGVAEDQIEWRPESSMGFRYSFPVELSPNREDKEGFYIQQRHTHDASNGVPFMFEEKPMVVTLQYVKRESELTENKKKGLDVIEEFTSRRTYTVKVDVSASKMKTLIGKLEKWTNDLADYTKQVSSGQGYVNPVRIARQAKVKLNKHILTTQAPEVKAKIEEIFNIKLTD